MQNGTTQKILIVDDEAYIRLLLEQTLEELEDEGIEILKTDNGEDALRIMQEKRPRLVFLDVMIPKINGFEVCRIAKRELHLDQIMIVILTAKGQEYDRETGEAAGANLYMTKPFDPDELLSLAKRMLRDDVADDVS
jgi:two-component system, OmpR family, alkaline phosphatase synthesis response regulator PhoP